MHRLRYHNKAVALGSVFQARNWRSRNRPEEVFLKQLSSFEMALIHVWFFFSFPKMLLKLSYCC